MHRGGQGARDNGTHAEGAELAGCAGFAGCGHGGLQRKEKAKHITNVRCGQGVMEWGAKV